MATKKWDAYRTLQVTNRTSREMTCVSWYTQYGNRCRWNPPAGNYQRVKDILSHIETLPPTGAIPWFPELARLCLCAKYHGDHAARMVAEWTGVVNEAEALRVQIETATRGGWETEKRGLARMIEGEKAQTEQANTTIAELKTELEDVKRRHSNAMKACESAVSDIGSKNREIEGLRTQLRSCEYAMRIWEDKSKDQKDEIREHKNQITDLNDKAIELTRALDVSEEALKKEKEKGAALHAQAKELTQIVSLLQSSLHAAEKNVRELRRTDEGLPSKSISEGKQPALPDQNESPTLADANDKLDINQKKLQSVTEELQMKKHQHTKSVNELHVLRRKLREKDVSSDQERKKSQEELEDLKQSLATVQKELARMTHSAEITREEGVARELRLSSQVAALNLEVGYYRKHLGRAFFRGLRHRIGHWRSRGDGHEVSGL